MNEEKKEYILQQVLPLLFALTNKIQTEGEKQFQELTVRQFMLLLTISHMEKENCSFNSIAARLGTTKQNVKQIVMNLEKKSIVSIEENPSDKRAKNVRITIQGNELGKQELPNASNFIAKLTKDFSKEELEQLQALLMKLFAFDENPYQMLH